MLERPQCWCRNSQPMQLTKQTDKKHTSPKTTPRRRFRWSEVLMIVVAVVQRWSLLVEWRLECNVLVTWSVVFRAATYRLVFVSSPQVVRPRVCLLCRQQRWPADQHCVDERRRRHSISARSRRTGPRNYSLIDLNPLIVTIGPSYSNTVIGTLAIDGWAATFGTARRGLSGAAVTAHPSGQCTNFILFDVAL